MAGLRHFLLRLLGGVPIEGTSSNRSEAAPTSTQALHAFRRIETPPSNLREEDLIPRYPPYMEGLPAVEPARVCAMQNELAAEITKLCDIEREAEGLVRRTLENYAAVVHLLPASENDHHAMAGGLYRHGLEVARHALMVLNNYTPFARDEYAERRRLLEPRMRFAVLTAALCHDAGKPLTDVNVTNDAGDRRWNPLAESLFAWAKKNGVDRYYLHWNQGRYNKHEPISLVMMERVAGTDGIAFINDPGSNLLTDMGEAVSGTPSALNIIGKVVKEADKISTERDKKRSGANGFSTGSGIPVDRYYLDTMRNFLRTKKWEPNKPGDRLWVMGGQVYILWPAGGSDIANALRGNGVKGIPLEPQTIARELMDRNIIAPRFLKDQRTTELWPVLPEPLKGSTSVALQAVRLTSPELLFEITPPSVEGVVGEVTSDQLQAPVTAPVPTPPPEPAVRTGETEATSLPQRQTEHTPPPAGHGVHPMSPPPSAADFVPPPAATAAPAPGGKPRLSFSSKSSTIEELENLGLMGAILSALADDLNRGRANGAWVRSNKGLPSAQSMGLRIMVKAPEALAAYHAEQSQLRAEAMESDLFETNEQAGLDFEQDEQIWWMLKADVSLAFNKLTAPYQERLRRDKEKEQRKSVDRNQPPPPGGGGGSAGLRVAASGQVKKAVQRAGGVSLPAAGSSSPPAPPAVPSAPLPPSSPGPELEATPPAAKEVTESGPDYQRIFSLLQSEYEQLKRRMGGEPVSARQLIKAVRDAHQIDLGFGHVKKWVSSTGLPMELVKDISTNEMVLMEKGDQ